MLTSSQLLTLQVELATDPTSGGYAALLATGQDSALAALLNAPVFSGRRQVTPDALKAILMNLGAWARLWGIALTSEAPVELRAAAYTVFDACAPESLRSVNLDGGAAELMFAAFLAAGVLNEVEQELVLAIGDTMVSRAEQLCGLGTVVSLGNVVQLRQALEGD